MHGLKSESSLVRLPRRKVDQERRREHIRTIRAKKGTGSKTVVHLLAACVLLSSSSKRKAMDLSVILWVHYVLLSACVLAPGPPRRREMVAG